METNLLLENIGLNIRKYKRQKGLAFLIFLIANENQEFTYIDMYQLVHDSVFYGYDKVFKMAPIPKVDKRTITEVQKRLSQISATPDLCYTESLVIEQKQLLDYLNEVTYGGRISNFPDAFARCRDSMSRAMRLALEEMKKIQPAEYEIVMQRLNRQKSGVVWISA